ncbi:LysR family transcriptional regulator [Gordonia sp. HY002]|uniref:LysR family transcriptional regulator n=1 Tax=Gordonia zhenghanii TaxID=2911516 RepID=UPI001EEFD80B|nr:LysR family transcriptional regulator [Gordonia zhenghanii]MCF8569285.1 LysR family transcriptional regulator [Gordonia zhenghanii]MCF8607195.1 LysR family transcriptional regulator [Gordonia zhenghanii]
MDMVRHMRVFVAVAEEGHFGSAARRVALSQPAVSQILRRTERELGVELIRRTQRGAELTDAGRAMLPRARLLVGDAERLTADARRFDDARQTLRWGVADQCGRRVAAVCASRISDRSREQAPTVGSTVGLIERVASELLDVAVVEHPALVSGLESTASIRFSRAIVIPSSHPASTVDRPRLAQLSDLELAYAPRTTNPAGFDQLIDELRAAGVDPRTTAATSVLEATALIASGRAFTVTADPSAFGTVSGVSVMPVDPDRLRIRLHVVYRSTTHRDLAEQLASDLWRLSRSTR